MISFLAARSFDVIQTAPDDADAPAICRNLELQRNDGFAVFASRDGKIFADATGPVPESLPPIRDAATATGMYDEP